MNEEEIQEPSQYDIDLLNLTEEIINVVNDLRGRVLILERQVFDDQSS